MKASIAIAARIRSQIAQGTLLPGDLLPIEGELTEQLSRSKPVVREALRILETEGLIEVKRGLGGGPRVRHPSLVDAAKTMGLHLQLGDVPVLDVWAARDRIIASAVERLAENGDRSAAEPLDAAVAALVASQGDLEAFNRHMLDVGETAVRAAGSATDGLLVGALRHVVEAEVGAATSRVSDDAGFELARREGAAIAEAWAQAVRHVRAGRAREARRAYEEQADVLRCLIGAVIGDLTVGDAAARPR